MATEKVSLADIIIHLVRLPACLSKDYRDATVLKSSFFFKSQNKQNSINSNPYFHFNSRQPRLRFCLQSAVLADLQLDQPVSLSAARSC